MSRNLVGPKEVPTAIENSSQGGPTCPRLILQCRLVLFLTSRVILGTFLWYFRYLKYSRYLYLTCRCLRVLVRTFGYFSASPENPFAPPGVGWSPLMTQAASSATQTFEANWPEWVWVNLDPCKPHCMSMLWRERQKMRGTCRLLRSVSKPPAGAAQGHLRPPADSAPGYFRSPQTTLGNFGIRLWLT